MALLCAPPAWTQEARASGRIVRVVTGDTMPVGSVSVVLHRVSQTAQGPIDTVPTGISGRFDIRFRADTSALFLFSVRYEGIEYFSAPIRGYAGRPDTGLVIIVADTSSTIPVTVAERTLLIGRPDQSNSRMVIDWLVLFNPGDRTRVVSDTRPAWAVPLPEEAQQVALADIHLSQFSPDAVSFRGDSIQVFAPISPGRKELVLQYRIPGTAKRMVVPAPGTDSVFVLIEEPDARVERPALTRSAGQQVEGRGFQRWVGVLGSASEIAIALPGPGLSAKSLLPALLAITILGFVGLALVRARRRTVQPEGADPIALADAIARLDQQKTDAGVGWSADRETTYRAERARLKVLLERALASPRRHS